MQSVLSCLIQAEFYSWSIFGQGLNATLLGRAPESDGGMKAQLDPDVQNYYTEVANEEINHVRKHAATFIVTCPAEAHGFASMLALQGRQTLINTNAQYCPIAAKCGQVIHICHRYLLHVLCNDLLQVAFLRNQLGAAAIPCPTLNIGSSWAAIVNASLGNQAISSYTFSPYTNTLDFLFGTLLAPLCAPLRSLALHFEALFWGSQHDDSVGQVWLPCRLIHPGRCWSDSL